MMNCFTLKKILSDKILVGISFKLIYSFWGVVLQSSAILRLIYEVLKYWCHWRQIHFLLHYINYGCDKTKVYPAVELLDGVESVV